MEEPNASYLARSMANHCESKLDDLNADNVLLSREEAALTLGLLTGLADILEADELRHARLAK